MTHHYDMYTAFEGRTLKRSLKLKAIYQPTMQERSSK